MAGLFLDRFHTLLIYQVEGHGTGRNGVEFGVGANSMPNITLAQICLVKFT